MSLLNELSSEILLRYLKKAPSRAMDTAYQAGKFYKKTDSEDYKEPFDKTKKRVKFMKKAVDRLSLDNDIKNIIKHIKVKPHYKMIDGKMTTEIYDENNKFPNAEINKHVPYGYYVLVKSLHKLGSGPHSTFGKANQISGGNSNHQVLKHIGGGKFHSVNFSDDKGRPYKGQIYDTSKLDDTAKSNLHEAETKSTGLSKKTLDSYITKMLSKRVQMYIDGKVGAEMMKNHYKKVRVAQDKIDNKHASEIKKIFGESLVMKIQEEFPTNSMGASSSTSGPVQTFDPLLFHGERKKKIRNIIAKRRKEQGL